MYSPDTQSAMQVNTKIVPNSRSRCLKQDSAEGSTWNSKALLAPHSQGSTDNWGLFLSEYQSGAAAFPYRTQALGSQSLAHFMTSKLTSSCAFCLFSSSFRTPSWSSSSSLSCSMLSSALSGSGSSESSTSSATAGSFTLLSKSFCIIAVTRGFSSMISTVKSVSTAVGGSSMFLSSSVSLNSSFQSWWPFPCSTAESSGNWARQACVCLQFTHWKTYIYLRWFSLEVPGAKIWTMNKGGVPQHSNCSGCSSNHNGSPPTLPIGVSRIESGQDFFRIPKCTAIYQHKATGQLVIGDLPILRYNEFLEYSGGADTPVLDHSS